MVSSPAADTVQIRWPLPRSSQRGSSNRAARTCAITLTCQLSAQFASVSSPRATPAFAQNRSISPSTSLAAATSAATPSSLAASPGAAVPPHDCATCAEAPAFRSLTTTRAPSAANLRASAAPMPLPPPVTTTPAPLTDSIPYSLHRSPWLQVCGLAPGLSRAAPPRGSQEVEVARPASATRRRAQAGTSPPGLVTVLFRPGCLAAPKIHGLLESTPRRSGRSLGGVTRRYEG